MKIVDIGEKSHDDDLITKLKSEVFDLFPFDAE